MSSGVYVDIYIYREFGIPFLANPPKVTRFAPAITDSSLIGEPRRLGDVGRAAGSGPTVARGVELEPCGNLVDELTP
jgi:hypothetical protein